MNDCGLPEKAHSQGGDLLIELWFMLEEHFGEEEE